MKSVSIKNIISKIICWILLLQIVNISINPPDLQRPKYTSVTHQDDLSINKIESIYEFISENILDVEVPESEEEEIDTSSPTLELYFYKRTYSKLQAFVFPIEHFSHYSNRFPSVHKEPSSPPPKFA